MISQLDNLLTFFLAFCKLFKCNYGNKILNQNVGVFFDFQFFICFTFRDKYVPSKFTNYTLFLSSSNLIWINTSAFIFNDKKISLFRTTRYTNIANG